MGRFGFLALLMLLAACADEPRWVTTFFTPFHEMPDGASGKTFFMSPDKNDEGNLAWATYANQIAQGLEARGLRRVATPEAADYEVAFSFTIRPDYFGYRGIGEYQRTLRLAMMDVAKTRATRRTVFIYDVAATSTGTAGDIYVVLPAIIKALFVDWPGENGRTQTRKVLMP